MEELVRNLSHLLADVILPRLRIVQASQTEQIAANARLQDSIDSLRISIEQQFASLSEQLTACRAELAATQAVLQATQQAQAAMQAGQLTLVH